MGTLGASFPRRLGNGFWSALFPGRGRVMGGPFDLAGIFGEFSMGTVGVVGIVGTFRGGSAGSPGIGLIAGVSKGGLGTAGFPMGTGGFPMVAGGVPMGIDEIPVGSCWYSALAIVVVTVSMRNIIVVGSSISA